MHAVAYIFLIVLHWAAHKSDDPHLVVLPLSVLQCQLYTHNNNNNTKIKWLTTRV